MFETTYDFKSTSTTVAAKAQASRARLELLEATRQLATSAAAAKAVEFELVRLSEQSRVMTPHTATLAHLFFSSAKGGAVRLLTVIYIYISYIYLMFILAYQLVMSTFD